MPNFRRLTAALIAVVLLGIAGMGMILWREGYRVYVVHTGSMVPTYDPGDIVIDKAPSGKYHRGEVLTFLHSALSDDVVTHRVHRVLPSGLIETKGDANRTADAWQIRPDQVQGQAIDRVRRLGYVLVYLRQPAGIASLATGVLAIVLLWGLFFPPADEQSTQSPRTRHRLKFGSVRFGSLVRIAKLPKDQSQLGAPIPG